MNPTAVPNLEFAIDLSEENRYRLINNITDWATTLRLDTIDSSMINLERSIRTRVGEYLVVIRLDPTKDGKYALTLNMGNPHPVGDEFVQLLQKEIPNALAFLGGLERHTTIIPRIKVKMSTRQINNLLGNPAEIIRETSVYHWIYNHPAGRYRIVVQHDVVVGVIEYPKTDEPELNLKTKIRAFLHKIRL